MHRLPTRNLAALLLASTAVASCGGLTEPVVASVECNQTQTECINAWFDEKFEELLAFSPMQQTALGLKTDYDKIDDLSVEAEQAQLEWWQNTTAEMEANFDYDELSDDAKLSWDMWQFRKDQAQNAAGFRNQQYILHQMNGTHSALPSFLISQHKVESESDMTAFIARIGGIGTAMDQLLVRAQANAEAGTRPPSWSYDAVIAESKKITSGAPFDDAEDAEPSALWTASEGHLAKLVEDEVITEDRAGELREEARLALTQKMAPAYGRVIDWFTQDQPNADKEARGVSALSDGGDFYKYRLGAMTTTDLTADEIHDIGLSEVARIRSEMEEIKDQVEFDGDLQAFFAFMREDDQFYFPDNDAGAQMYIDAAKKHLAFIDTKLPEYFGILPKAPLEVRRVEPFREQDGAAQHYRTGTPDGSRPGIYYAHLSDMRAMPIPSLEVIAYHEGNPGHHMQLSIAQELTGIPKFRSQGFYLSAFGEGWALYSEKLAKEMGAYQDPYSDFGRLTTEMWRAIRLVVDTGIHSKGWSEQQAVDYFLANSPIPEAAVKSEVRRYIVMPGQATAYKIGMIRIQELRAKAEKELGDKFDIRGFHDTVLGGGSVPLDLLEKRVDQWVAAQKAA
ncbi:DUF885 domain-containing protein [Pontixanthobacter aquaemixtae]|uniref:DUF885 family protein n=1 Tax=Pontixanthobacter aquaemixtae TaxID=1958940 RepID=A0A845A0E5_9SPHN|nr:DUF885 domain-containing protein [Pontixanthobacter aquaemixtae]MXO91149.1 DUF885 family protein [Pontixanthobacter aquaemixtae]